MPRTEGIYISKGWTRRPSAVEREDYDDAWERTFGGRDEPKPKKKRKPRQKLRQMDPFKIADTMAPGFGDKWGRA